MSDEPKEIANAMNSAAEGQPGTSSPQKEPQADDETPL